jgi:hypothetical protein
VAFASGAEWRWSDKKVWGWEQPLFPDRRWRRAVEVETSDALPSIEETYAEALQRATAMASLHGRTRVALTPADSLTTALGRPTREQVVTARTEAATTLQSLELANGDALARRLQLGAARLLAEPDATTETLIQRVYERALSRPPVPREAALAHDLIGTTPTADGVEDLLWAVLMLPEFQLIH